MEGEKDEIQRREEERVNEDKEGEENGVGSWRQLEEKRTRYEGGKGNFRVMRRVEDKGRERRG